MIKVLPSAAAHLKLQTGQGRRWRRGAAGLSAPQYPAHRSYTELAPDRFKDFWRDHAVVVRECFDRVVTAQPFAELYGQRSNYQAGFMVGKRHSRVWAMSEKISFVDTSGRPVSGHFEVSEGLGREPINIQGVRLARVGYAPIATKFRSAAKCRDGPPSDMQTICGRPIRHPNSMLTTTGSAALRAHPETKDRLIERIPNRHRRERA